MDKWRSEAKPTKSDFDPPIVSMTSAIIKNLINVARTDILFKSRKHQESILIPAKTGLIKIITTLHYTTN